VQRPARRSDDLLQLTQQLLIAQQVPLGHQKNRDARPLAPRIAPAALSTLALPVPSASTISTSFPGRPSISFVASEIASNSAVGLLALDRIAVRLTSARLVVQPRSTLNDSLNE
jgi:hypothetical protein